MFADIFRFPIFAFFFPMRVFCVGFSGSVATLCEWQEEGVDNSGARQIGSGLVCCVKAGKKKGWWLVVRDQKGK